MVPFFPKGISSKGLALYALSVLVVSMLFRDFAMSFVWIVMGFLEVAVFFVLSPRFSRGWQIETKKGYVRLLFIFALSLRVIWVVFSYSFYLSKTGQPFEWGAALPKKMSLNWFMPALVNISVGSFFTTIGEDGTMW